MTETLPRPNPKSPSAAVFILFPAIAMLLGWGLRGYIGGGPFGAMIPGAFAALTFSLLLGHSLPFAAVVACFGAIGIGFGGEETYGQTLGLAKAVDTRAWGLIGVTLKGAVWGLYGGAVIGAGLTHRQYPRKTLAAAFAIAVAAFFIGWKLINEPKLIYFSDPLNKPREESWAGLLFAGVAFLAWVTAKGRGAQRFVPLRFSLIGTIGGGLGFGLGTLWLVYGPSIPIEQKWWGWWKMMEFSFGGIFGAALGLAAWLCRDRLADADSGDRATDAGWLPLAAAIVLVPAFLWGIPALIAAAGVKDSPFGPTGSIAAIFFTFVTFGGLCCALGLWSQAAAWHIAITLTFLHTVVDLDDSLFDKDGYAVAKTIHILATIAATAIVAALVQLFRRSQQPIRNLYLLIVWSCCATAFVRGFVHPSLLNAPDGSGFFTALAKTQPSLIIVQAIFIVSALATTAFIMQTTEPRRH